MNNYDNLAHLTTLIMTNLTIPWNSDIQYTVWTAIKSQ